MTRSVKYKQLLIESLKDRHEAAAYINAVLEETKDGSSELQKLLLAALKNVVEAQGGFTQLAKKTELGRGSLYKTLSSRGNPRLSTLTRIIHALGFNVKLHVASKSSF